MFGQYKRLRDEWTGTLTGKGQNWGGSLLRPEATGYGACYFAQAMLATRGESFEGKTVVISGAGNVATYAIEKAEQLGAKVIAVSDTKGYVRDDEGISVEALEAIYNAKRSGIERAMEFITDSAEDAAAILCEFDGNTAEEELEYLEKGVYTPQTSKLFEMATFLSDAEFIDKKIESYSDLVYSNVTGD